MKKYLLALILILLSSCTTVEFYRLQGWEVYKVENISVFYHKQNYSKVLSPDISFVKGVAEEQIKAISKANSILKKEIKYPISIYLYNMDEQIVSRNQHGGRADLQSNTVIYSYDGSITYNKYGEKYYVGIHEIAHIIFANEFKYYTNNNRLITEGIAVWFEDGYQKIGIISKKYNAKFTYKKSLDQWMSQYAYILPSIKEVLDNQESMKESLFYPIAGMFVKYLYEKFGIETIKILYKNSNYSLEKTLIKELNMDLNDIDNEFKMYVNKYVDEHNVEYQDFISK